MLVEGEGPRSVVKEIEPMYVNLCDPVWGSQPLPALIPSSFLLYVHVWYMYVCMRGICVYIRMCACRGPDNFRCHSRGTTYILFRQCLPLAWNLLSRLNCLARKSPGSAYFYLPSGWDYKHRVTPAFPVLGIELMSFCLQVKHSTNWTTSF